MSDPVRQLTRERDRLRLLLEINTAVVSHLDLGDLLRAVSALLGRLVPHDMSVIALYDAEADGFRAGALDLPEHQDFMNLSFPDASLQLLIHGDVLEHVPDPWRAFREAARVVKPAGTMLFTVPFFDSEKNVVRARFEKGVLRHLLPEAYHGNPMQPEKGSLVFTEPGWQMLDDLQRAGFRHAEIGFCYDPFQGIVSSNGPAPENFMWPVIFRARLICSTRATRALLAPGTPRKPGKAFTSTATGPCSPSAVARS